MANFNKRVGYFRRGEPFVWATGAALTLILLTMATLLGVVLFHGLGAFWPARLALVTLEDGTKVLGEIQQREMNPTTALTRYQLKVGNRDLYGMDFRWVDVPGAATITYPPDAVALERQEYGNFYGFLQAVSTPSAVTLADWAAFENALEAILDERRELKRLQKALIAGGTRFSRAEAEGSPRAAELRAALEATAAEKQRVLDSLVAYTATFADADGQSKDIPLLEIVRWCRPNAMPRHEKLAYYAGRLAELFTGEPRESNTEGGLFPAIFGTVMLVVIMSIFSFPFGVVAGVYLREYAKEGVVVRAVRIAVNNLAGVPSIVYGIFGLGFFVYGMGGAIDRVFFADRLPTPTYGTGGILWASLTLGLLTVPVVIVSTEEALGAIPRGIREGSLALGSTKFQTLWRILLPMASPGIMTGFILSMARAAGEVAPLMITGVVKLAPSLPLDGQFPYLHPDRKFMHLGFHIFDIGFQSPNVEAAKPMVFVTTLLLVLIVLVLSSAAIYLRNRMRKKYTVTSI